MVVSDKTLHMALSTSYQLLVVLACWAVRGAGATAGLLAGCRLAGSPSALGPWPWLDLELGEHWHWH